MIAQRQEVGQVAVVGQGHAAGLKIGEHRLDIADEAAAGRGITGVADGRAPRQPLRQGAAAKGFGHIAHVALSVKPLAVERGDAAGFLATMLQGMQAKCG